MEGVKKVGGKKVQEIKKSVKKSSSKTEEEKN